MASESETMRDLRNDAAKARDKFLADNAASLDASTLGTRDPERYLRNRIEAAFTAGWNAAESRAPSAEAKDGFTRQDFELFRQWFDHTQDTSPAYLESRDYVLAAKLYTFLGMRVPNSIGIIAKQEASRG